eukprot:Gb_28182 [translate_table: standard]
MHVNTIKFLGYGKEHLKVILLRIDASLQGVRSCLPDFQSLPKNGKPENQKSIVSFIAGAAGVSIGSTKLRQETAEMIDIACKYVLEQRADDSILLTLIVRILDALVNYGSIEYDEWSNHKEAWRVDSTAIKEPPTNFITGYHAQGKRRPRWALIDRSYMHNTWRASESGYHQFRLDGSICLPEHIILLMKDLLNLSLHNYDAIRLSCHMENFNIFSAVTLPTEYLKESCVRGPFSAHPKEWILSRYIRFALF